MYKNNKYNKYNFIFYNPLKKNMIYMYRLQACLTLKL